MRYLLLLCCCCLTACAAVPETPLTPRGDSFVFEVRPLGAEGDLWRIVYADAGMLSFTFQRGTFIEPYAPAPLPAALRDELQQRIAACDFPARVSSTAPPRAGEPLYQFTVVNDRQEHFIKIWPHEAAVDPALQPLLETLRRALRLRTNRPLYF